MNAGGGGIHVIFGTGPVGLAVMDALLSRGCSIRLVNRSGMTDAPRGVEVLPGDVTDTSFARRACEGAAVVYQCLNAPYHRWPELFPRLQKGVIEGASSSGARLVAMENLYMYGPTGGKPLTEDLPYAATGRKGVTRARMSEALIDAHGRGVVQVAIGRASDFFGPRARDSAAGERVFRRALTGRSAQVLGNPDMPHTYTYVPDIGEGLAVLGQREEALGEVWHLPSPPTVTTRQFVEMVFEQTGHRPGIQVASGRLLQLLGVFNPAMRELREMLYEFEEPFVVDHSKFTKAFGDHSTPFPEAIRETLQWYRQTLPPSSG